MAVDACQASHAFAVYLSAFVALGAEFLRRQEVVQTRFIRFYLTMTLRALDLLHINMLGMEQRLVDPLCFSFRMALVAVLRTYDDFSVTFWNRSWPVQNETDEQLVLLRNGKMVTIMTVQ